MIACCVGDAARHCEQHYEYQTGFGRAHVSHRSSGVFRWEADMKAMVTPIDSVL
jgi:hypothetical protein